MLWLPARLTQVRTLAFSPDSRHLLAVGVNPQLGGLLRFGRVALWNLSDPAATPQAWIDRDLDPIAGFFLPDGRLLGVDNQGSWQACRTDGTDFLRSIRTRRTGRVEPAAVSPDGARLAQTDRRGVEGRSLPGNPRAEWRAALDERQEAFGAAFSPKSGLLAVAVRGWSGVDREWGLNVYSALNGEYLDWVPAEDGAFLPAWSPDAQLLAGIGQNAFGVVDANSRTPRARRFVPGAHLSAGAFHPSGRVLVTADEAGRVQVWDTAEWGTDPDDPDRPPARVLDWNVGAVQALALSPDGTLAAVAGARGEVVVWDVDV